MGLSMFFTKKVYLPCVLTDEEKATAKETFEYFGVNIEAVDSINVKFRTMYNAYAIHNWLFTNVMEDGEGIYINLIDYDNFKALKDDIDVALQNPTSPNNPIPKSFEYGQRHDDWYIADLKEAKNLCIDAMNELDGENMQIVEFSYWGGW